MEAEADNYLGPILRRSQFERALREAEADADGETLKLLEALAWELGLAPSETHDEHRWWLVFLRSVSPLKKTPPCPLAPDRLTQLKRLIGSHLLSRPELGQYDDLKQLRKLSEWDRTLLANEIRDAGFAPTLLFDHVLQQVAIRQTWNEIAGVFTPDEMETYLEWGRLVEESETFRQRYLPLERPEWDSRTRVPAAEQADKDQAEWRIDLGPGPYRDPEDAFRLPSLDGIRTHISRRDIWAMWLRSLMKGLARLAGRKG